MAILYNSNTPYEVTVIRCTEAQYYNFSDVKKGCMWPTESWEPFNVMPLVQTFIDDNSKYWFPMFKLLDANNRITDYGLSISRQNDIYHVNVSYYDYYNDHFQVDFQVATFQIGSFPSVYNVYFFYTNQMQAYNSSLYIVWGQSSFDIAGVAPYTQPNNVKIIKQNALFEDRPITETAIGSYIPVPITTSTPDDESLFNHYPYKVVADYAINGSAPVMGITKIFANREGALDLEYVYSYNNEEPVTPTPEDPPFDPSGPDPYPTNPQRDDTSDEIPIPTMPTIGVTSAGFINVYCPGMNALQGLGDILFPNVASATDVTDAVLKLCQAIQNQNLINYIIDCHVIPVTPATTTNANIKVGFRDTGISVPVVQYDYVDATCGTLNLAEWFKGAADYSATRSKLYLPFIGFVDMKPEFWQAGTIAVDYKFNVIDGSFMCYVKASSSKSNLSNTVIAQYAGNACMHLPVTGVNYAQMVSGIIGASVNLATGRSGGLEFAMSAVNTIARGGDVQQSNGYNSTAALMGVRYPYLMIERAVPAFPGSYGHDKGYPANITTNLGTVRGFTVIEDIDLSGFPFTSDELTELKQLLADGVYF